MASMLGLQLSVSLEHDSNAAAKLVQHVRLVVGSGIVVSNFKQWYFYRNSDWYLVVDDIKDSSLFNISDNTNSKLPSSNCAFSTPVEMLTALGDM